MSTENLIPAEEHPANIGLDFSFDGSIPCTVLKNYLSRSMVFLIMEETAGSTEDDIRLILHTGAKYIGRSAAVWKPGGWEYAVFPRYKEIIDSVHVFDPDVVFEACIFETTWKSVEDFEIPAHVFEAYGLPVEKRRFSYDAMLYPDGSFLNQWGKDGSCPDITRLETQLFYYFRACMIIDAGFEAIHWGQVHMIGRDDENFACYTDLLHKVRMYAKKHARRHFVLHNAHTNGIVDANGMLMFDFHAGPTRIMTSQYDVPHPASESHPQPAYIDPGFKGAIYGRSLGGKTHSGWACEHLPYFVELDNYGTIDKTELMNTPGIPFWPWGLDEISWFANQPAWYRREWLHYAYRAVQMGDPNGFFEMPGNRLALYLPPQDDRTGERTAQYARLMEHHPHPLGKLSQYFANRSDNASLGMDDEDTIREVWVRSNAELRRRSI